MRKTYVVTTETGRYVVDLNEKEHEQIRTRYHGYVKIVEVARLDFDAIASELHKEQKS